VDTVIKSAVTPAVTIFMLKPPGLSPPTDLLYHR
jgi:hypothetical protein